MNDEIKTEDIIESLLICTDFTENCSMCALVGRADDAIRRMNEGRNNEHRAN